MIKSFLRARILQQKVQVIHDHGNEATSGAIGTAGIGQIFPSASFFFLCCAFAVIQLS
ncbi:MAG: hypothetical protein OXE40_16515 [Gammaproteobacteria bacterium]|nr:hypothetical protein [Gammaproteobacteria bacterium]